MNTMTTPKYNKGKILNIWSFANKIQTFFKNYFGHWGTDIKALAN